MHTPQQLSIFKLSEPGARGFPFIPRQRFVPSSTVRDDVSLNVNLAAAIMSYIRVHAGDYLLQEQWTRENSELMHAQATTYAFVISSFSLACSSISAPASDSLAESARAYYLEK